MFFLKQKDSFETFDENINEGNNEPPLLLQPHQNFKKIHVHNNENKKMWFDEAYDDDNNADLEGKN